MPLPAETDASTPKHLRDKYAIVGVGETTYTRGSGKTTRALGTWAVRNAIDDAGLKAADVDGMLSYQSGRLHVQPVHRRRSRHPAQLLHGRVRRRLLHRGADRHRHRRDRGRHVQDRRDLPLDERLLPGPHRRHRRAGGGAGHGRHAAQPRLRLAERRADVQPHLHAPHVRVRHDAGAGGGRAGGPQRARLQQPQGLLQEARHGGGRGQQPHHLQAAASPRLLRRDRQRHRHHRHPRRARARLPSPAGADPRRRRALCKPRADMHYQHGPISRLPATTAATSCGRMPASDPRTSTSPAPTTPSPSPPCCSSRTTASARRARAGTTSATAPSSWAAGGRTTPAAAISARATPTA